MARANYDTMFGPSKTYEKVLSRTRPIPRLIRLLYSLAFSSTSSSSIFQVFLLASCKWARFRRSQPWTDFSRRYSISLSGGGQLMIRW